MITVLIFLLGVFGSVNAQFPTSVELATGQGPIGNLDPIWQCSPWFTTQPATSIGHTYSPALINNNCAPGYWVEPNTLPPPLNNSNWITGADGDCSNNVNSGYRFFRLTLNLPEMCGNSSVTNPGVYSINLSGYVDNQIIDVFVNGVSKGIAGGGFSLADGLNIFLDGPWVVGINYVDILVYNVPNGGSSNPYGLLMTANSNAANLDSDGDGVADLYDVCPCEAGNNQYGCTDPAGTTCDIDLIRTTFINAGCIELPLCYSDCSMYFLNPLGLSGSAAQAYAQQFGANLISIQSAAENACVVSELNRLGQSGIIWIGFNDEEVEGTFVWYDQSDVVYTNWAPGEPNNTGGNEQCVQIYADGYWNDLNCANTDVQSIIEVNLCPIFDVPSIIICENEQVTISVSEPILGSPPYTYEWSNGATTSSINPPAVSDTFTVSVFDRYNCSAIDTSTVLVHNLSTVILPDTVYICSGDTAVVNLVAANSNTTITYFFSNNAAVNLFDLGSAAEIRLRAVNNSNSSQSLNVTVNTLSNNCPNQQSFTIVVFPPPNLLITPQEASICKGDSIVLTASGMSIYSWSPEIGLDQSTVSQVTAFPNATQTYTVFASDINACKDTAMITVVVNEITPVEAGEDVAVCYLDTVVLAANSSDAAVNFQWNNGVVDNIPFVALTSGFYRVRNEDSNGCIAYDSLYLTVRALPTIVAGNPIASCDGYPIVLNAVGAGVGGNYVWNPSVPNGVVVSAQVGQGYYSVVGTDQYGCKNTDSIYVSIDAFPEIIFEVSQSGYCAPVEVVVSNQTANVFNCVWTIEGGQTFNTCDDVVQLYYQPGFYGATFYAESPNGCPSSLTKDSIIIIDKYPTAYFSIDPQQATIIDPTYRLVDESLLGVDRLWLIGGGQYSSTDSIFIHTFPDHPAWYSVLLISYSEYGCMDSTRQLVRINDELIFYIPNTFTPDGDEFNQHFQPIFSSGYDPTDFVLMVYNRWGEKVFESHDVHKGWDGFYGNSACQSGVYTWTIELKTSMSDERRKFNGHVNLLR